MGVTDFQVSHQWQKAERELTNAEENDVMKAKSG